MSEKDEITLRVSSTTNPASLAGAIIKNIEEDKDVYAVAVGAR